MADVFISATLRASGHVEVIRHIDGRRWGIAVSPHDEAGLDQHAPEIKPADKQKIMDKWATIPVPVPKPLRPPKTDAEIDAEMDAYMDNPFMKSMLEGLAELLPGPTTPQDVRDRIKAKGRGNIPR